ncbi:hypothetical protein BSU04_41810 [Caballeronia sordidicola]|uniref:Uncharacterized protein n=1 Tax=Caballeronia sordidicola TaxID=196367 RepID=A0A226WMR4_CABSO|nr:hypothetical protein BSU04_41810 [Caballeronia sordidicola]
MRWRPTLPGPAHSDNFRPSDIGMGSSIFREMPVQGHIHPQVVV